MSEAMRVVNHAASLPFVSDVYLSGHSQGGLTAALGAGLKPVSVKALLLLAPAMNIWDGARKGELFGMKFDPEDLPKEFGESDWRVSSNYLRAARMLPVKDAIRNYHGPVLIVHGTDDESVPYHYGADLVTEYGHAKLVTIEGEDHCYTRHLDKVTAAVRRFLEEQGAI